MHGLKCLICGREYFYDSKICRECEEYAIYSGLTKSDIFVVDSGNKFYKWNCSPIKKEVTKPFITSYDRKIDFCMTKEPQNYKFEKNSQYFWNSNTAIRLRTCLEESIEKNNLSLEPKVVDDFMEFLKVRKSSLLSFE